MQKTLNDMGPRAIGAKLVLTVLFYFSFVPVACSELYENEHFALDHAYTARGEIELYTGVVFPDSASNYYCHVRGLNQFTVIARFDIPCQDMITFSKHNPKIPVLNDSSMKSDIMLSSLIEPYRDQTWFVDMEEADYLLFGKGAAKDKQAWKSNVFASFINDQMLRVYLLYHDPNNISRSSEMYFYTGIRMPVTANNCQFIKKKVGIYEKTLNTSVRFDLPLQEGYEFIKTMNSYLHFENENNGRTRQNSAMQKLLDKFNQDAALVDSSKEILIGKPGSSLRFDVIIAAAFVKEKTMSFYFDFYETIGLRNEIEELGEFLGIYLNRDVKNIQTHLMWYGAGKMVRFDVPQTELKDILIQLEKNATVSALKKGDKLKDRIVENHGITWWTPGQIQDMKWCLKNNGLLFVAAGTIKGQDCATVFAKYNDVGF